MIFLFIKQVIFRLEFGIFDEIISAKEHLMLYQFKLYKAFL